MESTQAGNYLKAVSLNYTLTPIDIREQLTFNQEDTKAFLIQIRETLGVTEAFLISTCNRTEVYWNHPTVDAETVIRFLASFKAVKSELVIPYFQIFSNSPDAALHLYRVGIGLESQVLGDLQIIGQVKAAYQACADVQMAGPMLHRLLHGIFFANKRVVQETNFRSGAGSVSYATKELIEDLVPVKSASILLLGLGEIGTSTVKNLAESGFTNLSVCNRTLEKAHELASQLPIAVVPFTQWRSAVSTADVVISALPGNVLSIDSTVLTPSGKYQYLIDLGMPRSIHPAVEELPGVIVYNLDQIQDKVSSALELRRISIDAVEAIVREVLAEFSEWANEIQVSPVIHQIKNSLEQIRQEEMARFLRKANEEHQEWAEELTKSMMQRIMKTHVVQLKAACKRGESEQLVEVLNQLFNLENKVES